MSSVLKKPLKICSTKPMTGYYRDGYCKNLADDSGTHVVCATMNDEFLEFTKSKVNNLGLIDLHSQVKELSKQFKSISFTHVYREKNKKADELTNIVFDSKKHLNYTEEEKKSILDMFKDWS